jgi:short-subunit dehydrogenase
MSMAAIRSHFTKEITMSNKGTALITGASTGIGAVYADRLAKRGYDLILVARSKDKLDEVAQQIQSSTGRKAEVLQADLAVPADVKRVAERLATDASITAFVNNAGIASASKLLDSDLDYLDQIVQINVTAFTRLAVAAASNFVKKSSGLIINIGSVVALAPELLNGVYSGSKAFVQNFSISLKNELADKGVKVQMVLPGATATPLWGKAGVNVHTDLPAEWVMTTEDMVDASLAGLDQGEFATIPALPEASLFATYEKSRLALAPFLSQKNPAPRYGVGEKK